MDGRCWGPTHVLKLYGVGRSFTPLRGAYALLVLHIHTCTSVAANWRSKLAIFLLTAFSAPELRQIVIFSRAFIFLKFYHNRDTGEHCYIAMMRYHELGSFQRCIYRALTKSYYSGVFCAIPDYLHNLRIYTHASALLC